MYLTCVNERTSCFPMIFSKSAAVWLLTKRPRVLFFILHTKKPPWFSPGRLPSVRYRIRTPDLLVRSQTLYPAELNAHFFVALELFVYHSFPLTSCILHYPKRKVNTFLKKKLKFFRITVFCENKGFFPYFTVRTR